MSTRAWCLTSTHNPGSHPHALSLDGVIITAQQATPQGVVVLGELLAGIHFAKVLVELTRLSA